jgi:hypothetical protein
MTITIDLQPEIERGLTAQARAKGVSLAAYAQEILAREANPLEKPPHRTGQELVDVCARVRGFADELDITRRPSASRPVEFS